MFLLSLIKPNLPNHDYKNPSFPLRISFNFLYL